jgi:glycosyltransferase involved in cell wall biosynthesis
MNRLAVVRDKYLNPWDSDNYYGVINSDTELYLCGTGPDVDWEQIMRACPKAKILNYDDPYQVFHVEPTVIDVPDAHYPFSQYFAARHDKVVISSWDNLPGKNTNNRHALDALRRAWGVVARTRQAAACLKFDGVPEEKIIVIPAAVNTDLFHPPDSYTKFNIYSEDREENITFRRDDVILFVGRLTIEKGLLDLIWAMSLEDVPAELWVAGEGDREYFEPWANLAGVKVRWLGNLNRNQLAEAYRVATIFCVPPVPKIDIDPYAAWLEQFGQVYLEAMASGLPVVSTTSGSLPEVVGSAGLLVPARNFPALGKALNNMLKSDMRPQFGEAGRKKVLASFSQKKVGKQIRIGYGFENRN